MRLKHLKIDNWQAIRHIDILIERPIVLAVGANEAGKTSIADALKFAFLAEAARVDLKRDYPALIHEGAKRASIEIDTDQFSAAVSIDASGKVVDSLAGKDTPPALPYVIDAQRFATLTPDEKRSFLYNLMAVEITPAEIGKRLAARGCEPEKIEAISPLLRAGMEATAKEAAQRATMAKGAWKAITNESYGSQKAVAWKAPLPDFREEDARELTGLDKAIADAEAQLGDAQKRLGIAEHEARKATEREATIKSLREQAKTHAQIAEYVKNSTKDLEHAKAELLNAQRKAGTKPPEAKTQLKCPECGSLLTDSDDGESLVPWKAPEATPHDPEAAARIPLEQKAVKTYETVLARHKQNMEAADQAGKQLKALEDSAPAKPVDPDPIRETVKALQYEIATKRTRQAELKKAHEALDAAGERTKAARQHHANVLGWSAIAEALAPDGIPGELLAEALKPINDRLAQSAVDSGWKQVRIAADMGITCDGREYRLQSASSKFRCDVQIAEAVSHLSGLKFVCIDGADILDLPGRGELLGWLDVLASEGELDCGLVLATLKQLPAQLPDTFQAVWLERGAIRSEETQLEAA